VYDTFSFVFTRIVNNLQLVFTDEGQKLWRKNSNDFTEKNFRRRDWRKLISRKNSFFFLFFEIFQQQNHFAKKFKQQQCYLLKKLSTSWFFRETDQNMLDMASESNESTI